MTARDDGGGVLTAADAGDEAAIDLDAVDRKAAGAMMACAAAAYLSGIDTRRIVMIAFAVSGGLSAFGGILLAGYASKAAQSMGDAYLLPAIAAVVLGGTSILGGRGSYLGTVAGVILITLLQSILSVMQMPEAGRQIIYGVVIVLMLLLYGRAPASR